MRGYNISSDVCNNGFQMLCLLEGQPQNLLTFSRQIDVNHYARGKLTFLTVWRGVIKIVRQRNQKYSETLI